MLLLRSQVIISILAERGCLLAEERVDVYCLLIGECRRIASRDTIVRENFQRTENAAVHSPAHELLVGHLV